MSDPTPLDLARDLVARGLRPIPVPFKKKGPHVLGWQNLRLTADLLPGYFNGKAMNLGVQLGEPADWIVDVDLDHRRAVELADTLLPHTGMTWGRASKPRSHRLYRLTAPTGTRKWKSKRGGMIVELRSTGCQSIAPGSTHPSGEAVRWDDAGEPASIDPGVLIAALERLAETVRRELGEGPSPAGAPAPRPTGSGGPSNYAREALRREVERVATAPEGARNDSLNLAGFNLGTLIGAGELDRGLVEAELAAAALGSGLDPGEVRATLASAINAGEQHPRQREAPRGTTGPPTTHPPGGADSIHAHQGCVRARIVFDPVPITELGPSVPPEWIWPGYIARGHMTLFTGLWKAGKSTLIAHLLRDLERGGGLAGEAEPSKALVVTEESQTIWTRRRDELRLGAGIHLAARPFLARPAPEDWQTLVGMVAERVRSEGYGLVVLDTLPALWPVQNENDAAEVGAALMPLHAITDAGAGLLLVHHPRKGDGAEAQAARGSGALPGAVDVIVELRRFAAEEPTDRRRVLRAYGRFDEVPPEQVLELQTGGYVVLGDKAHATRADRDRTILVVLPDTPPGLTAAEVRDAWPSEPKPGKRALELALADGATDGNWQSAGRGVKNDPRRFWRSPGFDSRTNTPIGARMESFSVPEADPWGQT